MGTTKPQESLDDLISKKAVEFADQVHQAAAMADKEEEIRIGVERQLAFLAKAAGVKLEGRHEFTVASGRIDSVYERVIIEYKNPSSPGDRIGPRADSPGTKKVVEQIKKRFYDLQSEQHQPINSLFGVGLDGNYFVFVRFRQDKWDVREPSPVTRYSAEQFLRALFNLGQKGRAYLPEYLAGDFGAVEGSIATVGIHTLYEAISGTTNPKAQVFFSQWKILFGEVCGYDVDSPSDKIKKLADFYGVPLKGFKPAELLFAVHTYYALFMKILAAELVGFGSMDVPTPAKRMAGAPSGAKLKREMEELEAGSIFRHLNITNFLEGDLFAWYVPVWSEPIEKLVRAMVDRLDDYNPGTLSEDPAGSRDLLKKLYQQLFPKSVRHDMGEYYTPDWLAEHVLDELGYDGDPDKRILDPGCGSGTFPVMEISRIRQWYDKNREKCGFGEGDLCRKILANVIGFDLNPLAVMAARTNYLIAIRDLIGHVDKVEIPIYLCDSILTPSTYGGLFAGATSTAKELKTAAAKFIIPTEIATNRDDVAKYAEQLEFCIKNRYSPKEFIERCHEDGLPVSVENLHTDLYKELVQLDKANKNGVWARIIKNSFAPLFIGRVDYVAGNPPWVNWESLPEDYRETLKPLWQQYGLFTLSGSAARLGGGKKDLSMLFVYLCLDNYLQEGGQLGFVITQTVFKTREAGEGFRKLSFSTDDEIVYIVPVRVIDMTMLHPFEGATNRTATFVCQRSSSATKWPVPYEVWTPTAWRNVPESADLRAVLRGITRKKLGAMPMQKGAPRSAWMTVATDAIPGLNKATGWTPIKAHAGICTWMNGVFWLSHTAPAKAHKVQIANWHDVGKIKVESVNTVIEDALVYPLLRGRDVHRWKSQPSASILVTQDPTTRTGIADGVMKREYPLTYQYLRRFEALLSKRPGYIKYFDPPNDPFWTVYNVGRYSFAPHRIVFKELTDFFQCAVVESEGKPAVADTKLRFIECESEDEAFFLCGLLNSAPAVLYLYSTATWVQTADYQASDIARVRLPKIEASNALHGKISRISRECHSAVASGDAERLEECERALDAAAMELWGITRKEMKAIEEALRELGFYSRRETVANSEDEE